MTQHQLAEALGVHWVTISNLERGKAQLTQSWIEQLSQFFDVPVTDIFGPMPSREIVVEGFVANPAGVYMPLDKPIRKEVIIKDVGDTASYWLEVLDDVWAPFFHMGDLIQFSSLDHGQWFYAVGRMCIVFEGEHGYHTGVVTEISDDGIVTCKPFASVLTLKIKAAEIGIITGYHPYGYTEKE